LQIRYAQSAVELTSLVGVIENVTAKHGDQKRALEAVNEKYGEYLKNIGLEKATLGNINDVYEKIIDNLLRQAVVKGLQEQITKTIEKTANALVGVELKQEKLETSYGRI
jgi:UDP-N-acetylmuramate-alanine ligase